MSPYQTTYKLILITQLIISENRYISLARSMLYVVNLLWESPLICNFEKMGICLRHCLPEVAKNSRQLHLIGFFVQVRYVLNWNKVFSLNQSPAFEKEMLVLCQQWPLCRVQFLEDAPWRVGSVINAPSTNLTIPKPIARAARISYVQCHFFFFLQKVIGNVTWYLSHHNAAGALTNTM